VVQAKETNYFNRHPTDQFFPLAIEIFGRLHKQADVFLDNCANAIWNLKWLESLPLLFWLLFFNKFF